MLTISKKIHLKIKDMKTGIKILIDNDKQGAKDLLKKLSSERIPFENPKLHSKLLGYPYIEGVFEQDPDNSIQRLMVELKILSVFGKHTCPKALLKVV